MSICVVSIINSKTLSKDSQFKIIALINKIKNNKIFNMRVDPSSNYLLILAAVISTLQDESKRQVPLSSALGYLCRVDRELNAKKLFSFVFI